MNYSFFLTMTDIGSPQRRPLSISRLSDRLRKRRCFADKDLDQTFNTLPTALVLPTVNFPVKNSFNICGCPSRFLQRQETQHEVCLTSLLSSSVNGISENSERFQRGWFESVPQPKHDAIAHVPQVLWDHTQVSRLETETVQKNKLVRFPVINSSINIVGTKEHVLDTKVQCDKTHSLKFSISRILGVDA